MTPTLLIESRDDFDSDRDAFCSALARALVRDGTAVTVLLVQNGVLAARRRARSPQLAEMAAAGVTLLADDFSLRERGIEPQRLAAAVRAAPIDTVIDRLLDGWRVIWH